jgi:hypothetical protein
MRTASRRSKLAALSAALGCIAVLGLPQAAEAGTAPITLRYSGTFPPPTVVSTQPLIAVTVDHLVGEGSPLGAFTATYPHYVNFDARTFSGIALFTAANGDRLVMRLGGSGVPTSPTTFAVTFAGSILGGTGRFDDASGSVSGPGTVDLAELRVAASLAGTIRTHASADH